MGPAIIHCSAGIGRSGSFILVDSCLLQVQTNNGCRIDVYIMIVEKLLIWVAISPRIYWLDRISSRRGGDGEIVILARYRVHLL